MHSAECRVTACTLFGSMSSSLPVSGGGSTSQPATKKRKPGADDDCVTTERSAVADAVPEVSLRVACLDGTTLDVTVPQRELVREVKRTVGQVRCNVSRIACLASIRCMQRRSRD